MFSWSSFSKSSLLLTRRFVAHNRTIFSPSNGTKPFSTLRSSSTESKSSHELILKSLSGFFIIGSSLGLCYWSSSSSSSSASPISSFLVYADSSKGGDYANVVMDDDDDSCALKKPKFLFGDEFRRKVFFKYEKRIRMRSPPEKVFEYFASSRGPGGELFMTPADLMRAIVPVFPPSESDHVRQGYLKGEQVPGELQCAPSKFFMLFDTNNDGLISFAEYIFFVTLLSIPESSFSVAFRMFDLDHNGEIDREEFKKVMTLMRTQNRQGKKQRDGLRIGFKVSESVENGGLLEYFFGKDGKAGLEHGKFVQFLRDLHDEILVLEFAHYDYKKQGTISAKDFALSMVASADMSQINKFLARVDEISNEPNLRDRRITFEEFKTFAELRKRLEPLSYAIFSYGQVSGLLTKDDFRRAASHVCGVHITPNIVDIIFHVFDANQDGSLGSDEFVRVLQRREQDIVEPQETGLVGLISCWFDCTKKCSRKSSFFK
ncbi:EF-hand domain [Dillenia turbinata]|uniref:EF-hand domain n=1 Tax=Dillenia turbinata TaxID=194707 RepID=A0AAN8W1P7_9MAGN